MTAVRLITVSVDRIDVRGPSPDESVPAGGELLAVARRALSRGPDVWMVRIKGVPAPEFIVGEQAARERLAALDVSVHPAWCDRSLCSRTDDRAGGVHMSAPVVVEIQPPPLGARVELSLISSRHRDGRKLTRVNLAVITDPIPGDEDVPIEPYEMPIAPGPALALAEELRRIVALAVAAEDER